MPTSLQIKNVINFFTNYKSFYENIQVIIRVIPNMYPVLINIELDILSQETKKVINTIAYSKHFELQLLNFAYTKIIKLQIFVAYRLELITELI